MRDLVQSLGRDDPLEKGLATHFSIHAWRIPWAEEPGGLHSTGSPRVGHDWAINTHSLHICCLVTQLCLTLCDPWTAARQASLSLTIPSLLKPMSIELVMPSNHLVLCHALLLPSVFPSTTALYINPQDTCSLSQTIQALGFFFSWHSFHSPPSPPLLQPHCPFLGTLSWVQLLQRDNTVGGIWPPQVGIYNNLLAAKLCPFDFGPQLWAYEELFDILTYHIHTCSLSWHTFQASPS